MVRAAGPGDLAAILAVERSCLTAPHWDEAEYGRMLAGLAAVERVVFVALDETVKGFAVGSVAGGSGELESVAVEAAGRGQGTGEALCRRVVEWAVERGANEVRLEVRAASEAAIRLYRRLGFAVVGQRPRYYADPVEDALLMRLALVGGQG